MDERDKRWLELLMLTWATLGVHWRQVHRLLAQTSWCDEQERFAIVDEYKRRFGS